MGEVEKIEGTDKSPLKIVGIFCRVLPPLRLEFTLRFFKLSFMKFKSLIFSAFIVTLMACGQTNTPGMTAGSDSESSHWVKDTAKINALIAMKDNMIAGAGDLVETGRAHAPIVEGTNGFEFYEFPGNRLALKGSFSSEESEIRIGAFLVDGKLAYVAFRDFHKTAPSYGKEMYLYFDNGKMFYAEERKVPLEPGQGPAAIHTVPLLASTRTSEELMADITPYYEQTMKAVEPYFSH